MFSTFSVIAVFYFNAKERKVGAEGTQRGGRGYISYLHEWLELV